VHILDATKYHKVTGYFTGYKEAGLLGYKKEKIKEEKRKK